MVQFSFVTFDLGDRKIFKDLSFTLGPSKYGLVGPNGVGKSTLAKLICGFLEPQKGVIQKSGKTIYFSQFEERPIQTVAEYLLEIWNSTQTDSEQISRLLGNIDMNSSLETLSGGEWMKVRFAKALSEPFDLLILDEPTNNLDQEGRKFIYEFVSEIQNPLLIISHDQLLLEKVDEILELSNLGISKYGGNFSFYSQQRQLERQNFGENLALRKKQLRLKEKEYLQKIESQEKRMRKGARDAAKGGTPKIVLGAMKRQAQKTMARLETRESESIDEATLQKRQAWERSKIDPFHRFDFESEKPAESKVHFLAENFNFRFLDSNRKFWNRDLSFCIKGSERWLIEGANGAGKSTLLSFLLGRENIKGMTTGILEKHTKQIAYLDQTYGALDPELSLIDNLLGDTRFPITELRNELAFFNFRGEQTRQKIKSMSGGEILKASLAKAVLAKELPNVLVLDEPTNNLDLQSLELLSMALSKFQGAIIICSHDKTFLETLQIENCLKLE